MCHTSKPNILFDLPLPPGFYPPITKTNHPDNTPQNTVHEDQPVNPSNISQEKDSLKTTPSLENYPTHSPAITTISEENSIKVIINNR